jgi:hypothetical protein
MGVKNNSNLAMEKHVKSRAAEIVLPSAVLFALSGCLTGCTHISLRNNTGHSTATLMDIHFKQVLDNVARFYDNPDTVPSFAVVTAGTVAVGDQAGVGVSATYSPTLNSAQQGGGALPILSLLFPFNGSRSLNENWSLTPVTDADNLRRLRCAYRLLLQGHSASNYAFCDQQMKEFFAGEEANLADDFPPHGWFNVGTKHAVDPKACYVGRHVDTYVWVTAAGMNGLALFALGTLDLATGKVHTPQETVVRKYKGAPTPENLVETEVTSTQDDGEALKAIREGRIKPEHQRNLQPAPFNPGLFTLPR